MTYKLTDPKFEVLQTDEVARIGNLRTAHGDLKTPIVFPVHNLGAQRGWNTPRYWEAFPSIKTAMFNAYYIFRNYRKIHEKINSAGGVHNFLGFQGVAFVDSGGYVGLKTPLNIDQETAMMIQEKVGADIASTLDFPFNMRRDLRIYDRIKESVKNAQKAREQKLREDMLLYASVHGNDPLILRNVLRFLSKFDAFDGYAIGSLLPVRNDLRLVIDLIISARSTIPDRPLHIFGLGGFLTTPLLAYLGVDSSDSTSFIICAGKRLYFVPGYRGIPMGKLAKMGELPCNCPVCCSKDIEEIRSDRSLITLHNLWTLWYEIRQVRFAIAEHRLGKYLEKRYSRAPAMKIAFEYAKRKLKHLF